jgi:selenocysteine lyase/cysteine desulfurase
VTLDILLDDFQEEPGYLDFASVGPIGAAVAAEGAALVELLSRVRFGTVPSLLEQDERVRNAISRATGFEAGSIVFQPNTSTGLMHVMFGLTGAVALSPAEYPSLTFAASRASEALGVVTPVWLETDHGRVTPGNLRDQLTDETVAVAVSLVDFRTGYLADLDGIRQVIGDRLLIVDAIQGFGVVDAPYSAADVVVSGGQKWVRAGWGTGFLALSDRALEHLTPVWSGYPGTDAGGLPVDEVLPATRGARAFSVTYPDPVAEARLATALDLMTDAGVGAISARIAESVTRIIDLADEYAVPVVSPRDERERAGIVVLEPAPENLTVLTASLHNHGVSSTTREGRVRLSPHVSTNEETFEMLRASLLSYGTATNI